MYCGADVIYVYDGSYDGALCCVFLAFLKKERPRAICPEDELEPTLCQVVPVATEPEKAERVALALAPKISPRAAQTVQDLFWSCAKNKELLMLDFIRLGFAQGARVTTMLGDETVAQVADAVKHLYKEAHNYKGFLRFSVYGPVLTAIIEPKNFVLPLLAPHFSARYRNEAFLIWDKTHRAACYSVQGDCRIGRLEALELPPADGPEQQTRALFTRYFETIAIEARENPRCQMSHLPLRYRGQMTEFAPQDVGAYNALRTADRPGLNR